MRNKLTVSVIIPNYNHAKYLPACIAAVAGQTRLPDEIIVIDDGSTDDSVQVIERLALKYPMVRLMRNESNIGAIATYNRGILEAKGDFVSVQGADDIVFPRLIERSMEMLELNPQAKLCVSIVRMHDLRSDLTYDSGVHVVDSACYLSPKDIVDLGRRGRLTFYLNGVMWHREELIRVGMFRPELRWHNDWYALFAIVFRHGMCFVPEVLSQFERQVSSFSADGMRTGMQREILCRALDLLLQPENADILPMFRRSGVMAPFGKEMLWINLSKPRFWKNLNPTYLRQALWWTLRIEAKKVLPRSIASLYYKMIGVSAEKNMAASPQG